MKTSNSTYSLVMQSEDKSRMLIEAAIYGAFILSVVFAMWQFAAQAVVVPTTHTSVASTHVSAAVDHRI